MLLNRLSRRRAPLEYNSHEPRGRFQLELPQLVFNASTNAYEGLSALPYNAVEAVLALSLSQLTQQPTLAARQAGGSAAFLMRCRRRHGGVCVDFASPQL